QGRRHPWDADDVGAPPVFGDGGDLNLVLMPGYVLVKSMYRYGNRNDRTGPGCRGARQRLTIVWNADDSTYGGGGIKRRTVRKRRSRPLGREFWNSRAEKRSGCPRINRKCTSHPQVFHT